MPRYRLTLVLLILLTPKLYAEKPRKPAPPQPASTYVSNETHERVTIAAEPGDTKETRPNTRLDYFSHGMMPMRVIVTNDTDKPVTLDDARINLITASDAVIHAATLDDLQRRMFTIKGSTGSKVPLPLPIPIPITTGKKNVDKKILDDDNDFGFQTTTVPPHATVAGYLYYDMQDLNSSTPDSFLKDATLELRKVRFASSSDYIDSYEIPLRPTAKDAAVKP
jgi:hypothetical protein